MLAVPCACADVMHGALGWLHALTFSHCHLTPSICTSMSAQIQYEVEFQKTVSDGGYANYQSSTSPIVASAEPYKEQEGPYYK